MSRKILLCLFFLCYKIELVLSDDPPPIVETGLGKVVGTWKHSLDGRKYAAFEGIPYALPPVKELRFEAPQAFGPWTGTWNATRSYTCLQSGTNIDGGDEDCLYLDIAVPTDTMGYGKKFDVVVHIHGGAFMSGSGQQMAKSQFIMERDIILVTINYRLGILGFLSTGDEAIPGNFGMKDQALALKWIKDNIASFGGNPDTITITGLSAGGASIHLHYFSPLSKGLFARGMSQSGTALDPWVIDRNPLQNARKLGVLVGCDQASTADLKECLKMRPALQLLDRQGLFHGYGQMPFSPFSPVIEKHSENPFLTEEPYTMLRRGNVLDVPWIVSTCADEGLLPSAWYYTDLENVDKLWPDIAQYLLDCNNTIPPPKRAEIAERVKEFYLGPGEHISEENFKKFTNMFTDRLFAIGSEISAKLQSKVNKSPVYYYYFNYEKAENSILTIFSNGNIKGVSHGQDLVFFYGSFAMKEFSEGDKKLKDACLDMLYSYATTGTPSFDGTDKWQPTKDSVLTYLNITDADDMELQTTDSLTPVDFWRSLGLLEYENYSIKDEL